MEFLILLVFLCLTCMVYARFELKDNNFFNVVDFGAVGDGKTDDSQAFGKAWAATCSAGGLATLFIPKQTFLLKPMIFEGPCSSPAIHVQIDGDLAAPNSIPEWNGADAWLKFKHIDGLTVDGTGHVGGQGAIWWPCKQNPQQCGTEPPTALKFIHCNGLHLSDLHIHDNPRNHISVEGCNGARLFHLTITAPEDSPNTDGIDISEIDDIQIYNSTIATGDDCIAIREGSSNVLISFITCGPGHGISVGSLGKDGSYAAVEQVKVLHSRFIGSQNGARVKTWQGGKGSANNILFQDLQMQSVKNPIIIDQYYCDQKSSCSNETSAVKVSDVTFDGIYGTAIGEVAINLACSQSMPCSNIILQNVDLTGADGSYCLDAYGPPCPSCTPNVCTKPE